ncbi:MAG TPA: nucleotidyltransferase family protein [Candidatus Paceibacterota bacterium]
MNFESKIKEIILSDERLMKILRSARELNLNDWFVAGGAIRNSVWDILSGFQNHTELNDIDLVYFDRNKANDEYDRNLSEQMKKKLSQFNWEVENQAKYESKGEVFNKTEDGIARWIETPTCIGVRLENDGLITVCAPNGLEDLFTGNIRINPKWPKPVYFEERKNKKRWDKVWSIARYTN